MQLRSFHHSLDVGFCLDSAWGRAASVRFEARKIVAFAGRWGAGVMVKLSVSSVTERNSGLKCRNQTRLTVKLKESSLTEAEANLQRVWANLCKGKEYDHCGP